MLNLGDDYRLFLVVTVRGAPQAVAWDCARTALLRDWWSTFHYHPDVGSALSEDLAYLESRGLRVRGASRFVLSLSSGPLCDDFSDPRALAPNLEGNPADREGLGSYLDQLAANPSVDEVVVVLMVDNDFGLNAEVDWPALGKALTDGRGLAGHYASRAGDNR